MGIVLRDGPLFFGSGDTVTTKLEIVNHMLTTVGVRKTASLVSTHPAVQQAISILESVDVDFQGRGWWFNREYALTLSEDGDGHVAVPADTLSFSIVASTLQANGPIAKARYVKRGTEIYDAVDHTFVIGSSLEADIVLQIEIPDMPSQAASYLKHLAAEAMYVDDDGDPLKMQRLKDRVTIAWQQLRAEELRVLATNALDSPIAQQLRYRIQTGSGSVNPMYPGGRIS